MCSLPHNQNRASATCGAAVSSRGANGPGLRVHSHKVLEVRLPEELEEACVLEEGDVRGAACVSKGSLLAAEGRPAHSKGPPKPARRRRRLGPGPAGSAHLEAAAHRHVCTGGAAYGGVELLRQLERRRCAEADVDVQHGTLLQR